MIIKAKTQNPAPIKFNELSARDAHQSLLATRMRIADRERLVALNAPAGFNALEVWGGATFDVSLRFLGENPWDNLRTLKAAVKAAAKKADTPEPQLMMLLRGQSIVGYKNYADDVVKAFVHKAAKNGMNIFRIFDGLNDTRNLQTAIDEVKGCKAEGLPVHAQGTICYTTGPLNDKAPKKASPLQRQKIFNLAYFVQKARELKKLGCDSICIKDMAGLMEPDVAAELIPAIQKETGLEVTLHMHAGMGLSDATLLRAIQAGVDVVDVGNAGLASGSGHSSAQTILDMMNRSKDRAIKARLPDISGPQLKAVREYLLSIRPKYAKWERPYNPELQQKTYKAQVPGGMLSNFEGQIKVQIKGMNVSFDEVLGKVLDEIPHVREDLGWPPLVTPCSQIVGVQAVLNVLGKLRGEERYAQMPEGTEKMLLGELGQTPAAPNPELVALAEQRTTRTRISHRPADTLKDGLKAAKAVMKEKGLKTTNAEDVLIVALWDSLGLEFLQNDNKTAQYEPEPSLPDHMTFRSPKPGVVAFGDAHQALGMHVMEAIAQTAKEINRIENGFFQGLPLEELEYRLGKYRGYIARQLKEIPARLHKSGFDKYQTELSLISGPTQSFNQIMRERCLALGVRPDSIPQILELELCKHFSVVAAE